MKFRTLSIIFLNLFLSSACGFESSSKNSSQLLNKEETNEKDVSNSEKTTEKISGSIAEKTGEIPKSLLSGFRKSGISEKIKVTDQSFKISSRPVLSPEQQKAIDQQLNEKVKENRFFEVRDLLEKGANPQTAFNEARNTISPQVLAILMIFGAEPRSDVEYNLNPFYPLVKGIITPQEAIQFHSKLDPLDFLHNKTIAEQEKIAGFFVSLFSYFRGESESDVLLWEAIELDRLKDAELALKAGANPNFGLEHPYLVNSRSHFLPLLAENGATVHHKVDDSTYAEKVIRFSGDANLVTKVLEFGFSLSLKASEHQLRLNQALAKAVLEESYHLPPHHEIEDLLKQGADPNFIIYNRGVDVKVKSILMYAAEIGRFYSSALLLKYGANPDFTFDGHTALSLTRGEDKRPHVEALLLNLFTPDEALNILDPQFRKQVLERQKNKEDHLKVLMAIYNAIYEHKSALKEHLNHE